MFSSKKDIDELFGEDAAMAVAKFIQGLEDAGDREFSRL